jgi:hypothetical protein
MHVAYKQKRPSNRWLERRSDLVMVIDWKSDDEPASHAAHQYRHQELVKAGRTAKENVWFIA